MCDLPQKYFSESEDESPDLEVPVSSAEEESSAFDDVSFDEELSQVSEGFRPSFNNNKFSFEVWEDAMLKEHLCELLSEKGAAPDYLVKRAIA